MLPIRYWNRIQNIGDAINPYILELVSGRKPYYATNAEEEHVLGVGSIFFMANRMSHIWGSGILDPRGDLFHIDLAKVHAVRGKRTLAALDSFGLTKPVPLGDPGVFVDEIPEIAETIGKGEIRRGTVIVPHYALVASEQIEQLARALDATILSPRTLSLDFVREIAGAEAVVSQSLHGLIFAEALGKPSAWIAPSDDHIWTFKFHDWYSNTVDPPLQPLPMDASGPKVRENIRLSGLAVDKRALRESFPALSDGERREGIGFRECRARAPLAVYVSTSDVCADVPRDAEAISCAAGDEAELRDALNKLSRRFDEPCCVLMTFGLAPAWLLNPGEVQRYVDLLTVFPDIHYICVLPASERGSRTPLPKRLQNDMAIHEWESEFGWRGMVLARNPINFSFAAPGYALFA